MGDKFDGTMKVLRPWNVGLTKETDERVKQYGKAGAKTRKGIFAGEKNPFYGRHHTKATRQEHGRVMKEKVKGDKNGMFGVRLFGEKNPNYRGGKISVECANCGEILYKDPGNLKKFGKKFFCNFGCMGKWMSRNQCGENNPMFAKEHTEKSREKMRRAKKDWHPSKEQIEKQKEAMREKWQDERYREETLRAILSGNHIKPNKAELRLFSILQKHFPGDYAINVKAEVMLLGGKIPDFVNVNGQKKVIELYGDYFHQDEKLENGGDGGEERREIFAKCGFETLIIWEHELLNEDLLVQRLTRFKYVRRKKSHC